MEKAKIQIRTGSWDHLGDFVCGPELQIVMSHELAGRHLENLWNVITSPNMVRFAWNLVCSKWLTTIRHVATFPPHTGIGRVAPESIPTSIRVTTVVTGSWNGSIRIHGISSVKMRLWRLGGPCLTRSTVLCHSYVSNVVTSWFAPIAVYSTLQSQRVKHGFHSNAIASVACVA